MKKVITKKANPAKKAAPGKKVCSGGSCSVPALKSKKLSTGFMGEVSKHFVTNEEACYNYSLGKMVANSLSGFLAGMIVTSLVWTVIVNVFFTQ